MWEKTTTSRCIALASGLCLAVAGSPALGAEHTFDGVYTGKRSLVGGTAGAMCPAEEDVSVAIHGATLTFTDSAFKVFTIGFRPSQDGSFGEIYEGGHTVNIHGRVIGDVIEADVTDYATDPPCAHHWRLKKG